MAIQDKPLLIVNGKTLPYNSKVSFQFLHNENTTY